MCVHCTCYTDHHSQSTALFELTFRPYRLSNHVGRGGRGEQRE